jgi:amino acid transporter
VLFMTRLWDLLLGRPIATEEGDAEQVGPWTGVPILGLDALASAAYGPEAMLTVLLPLGAGGPAAMVLLTPLTICVLFIVYVSYRQTIPAYPNGGGAYTVARENLGESASLLAAAALALDYVLNVAVAIAAGTGALVSAIPSLVPHTLLVCLLLLALLTLVNLRGVRSTGLAFAAPTYAFVGSMAALIVVGIYKAGVAPAGLVALAKPAPLAAHTLSAAPWLALHAFASGCTALTGVEAVSNGVPIFKQPRHRNAKRTLSLITCILAVLLVGQMLLCRLYGVGATPPGSPEFQSVLSQLLEAVAGRGVFYYVAIASIIGLLALSANTSFADFPRLCRILAGDKYLPEPFVHRGRRLAFSHGVLVLSALGGLLLVLFGGVTDRLIPLFAIGAFLAFTTSQAGMVAHWWKRRGLAAKRSMLINALGAVTTFVTLVVIMVAKFTEGAWISLLLIAGVMVLFHQVRRHYDFVARATTTTLSLDIGPPRPPLVIVPMRRWDAVSLKALRFGIGFAEEVVAVQVLTGDRDVDDLRARWHELAEGPTLAQGLKPPKLVVLRSDYRQLFAPLLHYVTELAEQHPDRQVAVVIPELVEPRWYHYLLHNHAASLLRTLLIFRGGPQVVVINAPWYLQDWAPEQARLRAFRGGLRRSFAGERTTKEAMQPGSVSSERNAPG